jgi:HEAT repeat protein
MLALARLDTSRKTRELLEDRLDDSDVFVRITAIRGLETLGDVKSRGPLQGRLEKDDAGTVRRRIKEALRDLTAGGQAEVRRLRDELDKMRDESHDLKQRLAKLEARLGEKPKEPGPEPEPRPKRTKATHARGKATKKPKGVARAAAAALKRTP